MGPEEKIRVLCALLLLCMLVFAPAEFLSLFWRRTTAGSAIPSVSQPKRVSTDTMPALSTNYASLYLGAAVVSMEPPSCHGGSALISDSVEKYVLCPCDAPRKQFVIQLIRDVEVRSVVVRNAEHFSSGVRNFTLLGSRQYPTPTWVVLGHFEAERRRGRQYFDVAPRSPVRYIKLQWATSHGAEPWCTITSFQVYGIDMLDTLVRYEDDDPVARHNGAEVSSVSQDVDGFHLPPIISTLGEVAAPFTTGGSTDLSSSDTTQANGVPTTLDSIDELAAGKGDDAAVTDETSRRIDTDEFLSTPPAAALSADARKKLCGSTDSSALTVMTPGLQGQGCDATQSTSWNATLQCAASDWVTVWGPSAPATCGVSDITRVTTPTSTSAPPVSLTNSESFSTSKYIYQGTAASRITQLLRQQRTMQQELSSLIQRERYMAQEHNRTRALLFEFYAKYKETVRESSEYRDRLRGLQLKFELLHERFPLRLQGGRDRAGEGHGIGEKCGVALSHNTTMGLAAFVFLALAVALMFISSCMPPKRVSGPPSGLERRYTLGGGGSGPLCVTRHQRGRARLMSAARQGVVVRDMPLPSSSK
ncbi:hypothetical protein JKF63_02829 [Porcisia hertigi]|uniref:SUN domain-containing protein n=1 Tax=Porcisia hertigi TaxID=2761500 RepID=A0A836IDU8_9TRYP|nr:hypothetical protein JKF63_02829 [Porcisia hertigi]